MRKQFLIVTLFVLVLRLSFLYQAIQGDDLYYLYGAEHAQVDPLHPTHARYAFLGHIVDMRGHSHPPFDAWYLAALIAAWRQVSEVPFHIAYIPFSLLAAWSALWLARRFSSRPLAATLLFLVTPVFVVNGNSLETDLPFVAFWLASLALFIRAVDRGSLLTLAASALAMVFAIFTAYQAILLAPILFLYGRKWKPAWAALFVAPLALAAWQWYERSTGGALPASVLAGYMQTYGFQAFAQKIRSAVALTAHLGWIVFPLLAAVAFRPVRRWHYVVVGAAMLASAFYDPNPLFWISIGVGVLVLLWCVLHLRDFLAEWILIFFAAALIIFFAGSARYLLPLALPVAILAANRLSVRWLYTGIALQLALSLSLAVVNYQFWDGYRQFARSLRSDAVARRVWVNGEWGLRFYLESEGALPYLAGQIVHPGEMVVSSSLAYPAQITTGGGALTTVSEREITASLPLRLVALNGRAAYSTTAFGLRPFDISDAPIDLLRAQIVVEKKPQLGRLRMNDPASADQIVSGIYEIENGQWRWMSGKGVVLLKAPSQPEPLQVRFFIPDQSPARNVKIFAGEQQVAEQVYPAPGAYTLTTPPVRSPRDVSISIVVDKTFSVPGDRRELGLVLSEVGFVTSDPGSSAKAR